MLDTELGQLVDRILRLNPTTRKVEKGGDEKTGPSSKRAGRRADELPAASGKTREE